MCSGFSLKEWVLVLIAVIGLGFVVGSFNREALAGPTNPAMTRISWFFFIPFEATYPVADLVLAFGILLFIAPLALLAWQWKQKRKPA